MRAVICFASLSLSAAAAFSAGAAADFVATHPPRFWEGREFPGAKGSSTVDDANVVHTRFDFTGGGHYVETAFDLEPAQALKTVTFQAQKPAGNALTVRVSDAKGQCFQKTVSHAGEGWTTFRFDMANWTGSWGGPADGVLQQPLKGFSILLENAQQSTPVGELLLKGITLEPYTGEELARLTHRSASRFCTRYTVTDFEGGAVNAFEHNRFSSHPAGALNKGLIRADFSKTDHVSVGHSLALLGTPEELLLTVEADAEAAGAELEIGIGSHFMCFTRTVGSIRPPLKEGQKICQTFVIPAPPAEGWQWHGGANDGKPNYPLRLSFLNLRKGAAKAQAFTLRLVSLEANTRIAHAKSLALRTRLLAAAAQPTAVTGELRNLDTIAHAGPLSVELKSWDGATLGTVSTNLAALLPGETQTFTLPLPALPADRMFVEGVATFASDRSELLATWASTWTALLGDAGSAELRPDLPWGMGVYLYRNGSDETGYRNMDRVAALARAAGVKWSREEFQWGRIEPRRGAYEFAFYDRLVETATRHGISVYALVAYWTPWTKPYEEEGFKDYCVFLRELVKRYKGRIKHWEIYNEPNIFFWSGPRERYPTLLKMAYEAVKAEDPEAQVLGCSTAGIDNRFIQMCLDAQAPFDALTIHPYRGALHEQAFMSELEATRKQVGGRPVWITEMGWPTIPGNATERQQAALLARCYLSAIGSGASHNICWYDFRNDGWNPYYNEENFGITYQDLTPKPAYRALASVCRTFQRGAPAITRIPAGTSAGSVYLFRMGDASAVWSDGVRVRVALTLAGTPTILNLMGEPVAAEQKDGHWLVETDALHPLILPGAAVSGVTVLSPPGTLVPDAVTF